VGSCRSVDVKIRVLAFSLVAAACAAPQEQPPDNAARPDLAPGIGIGGNGGGDMAVIEPPVDVDMSAMAGADLAGMTTPPDLSVPLPPPDLSVPPPPPDLATPPPDLAMCVKTTPTSTCSVFPQCGCASGQMCNTEDESTGKALCAQAGTTPVASGCTGNGDGICVAGSTCFNGACDSYCSTTADCPPDTVCLGTTGASGNPVPGRSVCTVHCNPLDPQSATGGYSPCGPAINCLAAADGNPGHFYCAGPTKATGTQDKSCNSGSTTACAPSFVCATDGISSYYCSKQCRRGVSGDCTSGHTCTSFGTKVYSGTQEIGFCW
jgi:hypothetical protein